MSDAMKPPPCLALLVLVSVGCLYEAPFVEEATRPTDPKLVGSWVEKVVPGEIPDRFVVLAFSENEYLIHYPADDEGLYYRAYPVRIGEADYVQLQLLGSPSGPAGRDGGRADYLLAKYDLEDPTLSFQLINPDVIDRKIKTSAGLREALTGNIGHKELFSEATVYIRARADK